MKKNDVGQQPRAFTRVPKEVPVMVKEITYPVSKIPGASGSSLEIAEGGMSFYSLTAFTVKSTVSVELDLKGWRALHRHITMTINVAAVAAPLTAVAEVVWCQPIETEDEGAGYRVGVKFCDIYQDDFVLFKKYLAALIKGEKEAETAKD